MATINDKLEQQDAQPRELTEDELDQTTGGRNGEYESGLYIPLDWVGNI